jgi:hypothetical protein
MSHLISYETGALNRVDVLGNNNVRQNRKKTQRSALGLATSWLCRIPTKSKTIVTTIAFAIAETMLWYPGQTSGAVTRDHVGA